MKTDTEIATDVFATVIGEDVEPTECGIALVRAGRRAVLDEVVKRGVVCRNGFDTCPEWYPGETAKWCVYCWATAQLEEMGHETT